MQLARNNLFSRDPFAEYAHNICTPACSFFKHTRARSWTHTSKGKVTCNSALHFQLGNLTVD